MIRAGLALALAAAAAVAAALPAGAVPSHDSLIRPGVGIGKIRLGMSAAQVRGAMGKPLAVANQQASFGRTAVEWQYGYGAYSVRLEGRRPNLRVTAVTTSVLKERTSQGFGVGTPESRLERAYGARLRCETLRTGHVGGSENHVVVLDKNRDCAFTHPNGTRTVFITWVKPVETYDAIVSPERWERDAEVLMVSIRS